MPIAVFAISGWEQDYLKSKLPSQTLFITSDIHVEHHIDEIKNCDVLCVNHLVHVTAEMIDQLPNLKLITTRSTGFDHIDFKKAQEKGITVCNVPFYGENTVAEFAFALLLALSRKIVPANNNLCDTGIFDTKNLMGFDLKGKTLGIIGTGHIGQHVIKMAGGFEMNILGCDAFPNKDLPDTLNFKYVEINDLLSKSDIISLHVPYMEATHHLINSKNIGFIKKGAVLINTARGPVVETEALVKALKDGTLSGAGLDVLENETALNTKMRKDDPQPNITQLNLQLIHMPQVIVTPHNAFNTKEAIERMLGVSAENITNFTNNQPTNIIKP